MAKRKGVPAIYYPEKKSEVPAYYGNFASKLPLFLAKYGLNAVDINKISAHNSQMPMLASQQAIDEAKAQQTTKLYDEELFKAEIDAKRIMNIIAEHASFIPSDGEALGFIVEHQPPDLSKVKPKITHITADRFKVIIDWVKGRMQGVIVYSNAEPVVGSIDDIKWVEIGRDLRSPYDDTQKNRTNQPETRYYMFKYMKDDLPIGLDSDIVKVLAEIY